MNTQEYNQTTTQRKFQSKNYNHKPSTKNRKLTAKQLEAIREKRNYLKGLSAPLKDLVNIGEIQSINEGLKQIYSAQGYKNLKSLRQWNEQGYKINKGEKALLLWGKPIAKQKDKNEEKQVENENKDTFDLYPLCYVFALSQVIKKEDSNA